MYCFPTNAAHADDTSRDILVLCAKSSSSQVNVMLKLGCFFSSSRVGYLVTDVKTYVASIQKSLPFIVLLSAKLGNGSR